MHGCSLDTMNLLIFLTGCFLSLQLQSVAAEEVCYDDLGCFSNDAPYDVFFNFPPKTPDEINTEFLLYTRLNPSLYMKIDRNDPSSLQYSTYSSMRRTVFIIHGYTEKGSRSEWMQTLKDKLLDLENLNVFLVDWVNGARDLYGLSVQNTRVVGRVIGKTMQFLNTETGAQFDRMHLIGHSLGAHIAGYAGAFQPGIARISGLDPAGPNFSLNDPLCRLDPTDAIFVDVIHSDAEVVGAGIVQAVGHMDFYPNGGKEQPGCPANLIDSIMNRLKASCSHSRVLELYIDSLDETQCAPVGYPCTSWDDFQSGKCSSCGLLNLRCPKMGYWADLSLSTGVFYLATGSQSPYCKL